MARITDIVLVACLVWLALLAGFTVGMHIMVAAHGVLISFGLFVTKHPFEGDPLFAEELPF